MSTTTLGLPLIVGEELIDDPVMMRHDPQEPGHPLHVERTMSRPVTVRHGTGAAGLLGSYTGGGTGSPDPSLGSYYGVPRKQRSVAAATAATMNPVAGIAMGDGLATAGVGIGALALLVTAYVAALGGVGYWLGGKVAPSESSAPAYKWAGAVGNVVAPGLGLAAVALVGLATRD